MVSNAYNTKHDGESGYPGFYNDIDPEIRQMYELAEREGRQPNCIYCGNPLEIGQTYYTDIRWRWNSVLRSYEKLENRDADCDKPYCLDCEAKDWNFTNNKWVQY